MLPIKQLSNQKGVSLLFVVLISSVILAIGVGVSVIILQETKMVDQVGNSVVSFYAADTGIEAQLFDLYKIPTSTAIDTIKNGDLNIANNIRAFFTVTPKCGKDNIGDCNISISNSDDCAALNYCLNSVGTYEKTKRAIEIKY
jgi:hypothetical protein